MSLVPKIRIEDRRRQQLADTRPDLVDRWLAAMEKDTRDVPARTKLVDARPADAVDTCYNGFGTPIPDQSVCPVLFRPTENPRQAAGEGAALDVAKCRLAPLDRSDYSVSFSDAQWALEAAFPTGVCDWTRNGIAQRGAIRG
jgi:hypothetical protein